MKAYLNARVSRATRSLFMSQDQRSKMLNAFIQHSTDDELLAVSRRRARSEHARDMVSISITLNEQNKRRIDALLKCPGCSFSALVRYVFDGEE